MISDPPDTRRRIGSPEAISWFARVCLSVTPKKRRGLRGERWTICMFENDATGIFLYRRLALFVAYRYHAFSALVEPGQECLAFRKGE